MTSRPSDYSRRRFIESMLAVVGTTALAGTAPWVGTLRAEAPAAVPATDRVRIGIIGPGSRGMLLMHFLRQNPGVDIVAVCDIYEPNLQSGLKLASPGAKGYTDHREMLERKDIHAVVIATPLHLHARHVLDSFAAGKHVFCEKSVGMTLHECRDILAAHKRTGLILHPGHQRLFDLQYLRALEMARRGDFGPITQIRAYWHRNGDWRRPVPDPKLERQINWRLYREYSLGLMTELASHHLQIANWFLGATPVEVMGSGSINFWKDGREVYDNVNLVYVYPNGVHVIYDSLISNKRHGSEIQLLGSKGGIDLENSRMFSEKPPVAPGIKQLVNDLERKAFGALPIGGASWVPESASSNKGLPIIDKPSDQIPDSTQLSLEAFVTSVRENKVIPGLAEHGINSSIAVILGQEAMETRRIVNFATELAR
jgi:predicted dehydrogenase